MPKFTFKVGVYEPRRIICVAAADEKAAREKAWAALDKNCERRGIEPPVGWDLELQPAAGHFNGYRGQGHVIAPGAHEMED